MRKGSLLFIDNHTAKMGLVGVVASLDQNQAASDLHYDFLLLLASYCYIYHENQEL